MRTIFLIAALIVFAVGSTAKAQSYSGSSGGGYDPSTSALGRPGMFGNRTLGGAIRPGTRTLGGAQGNGNDLGAARFMRENRQQGQPIGLNPNVLNPFSGGNPQTTPGSGVPYSASYPTGELPNTQGPRRTQQKQSPGNSQRSSAVRTEYRADFDHPAPEADRLSTTLARRLSQTRAIQWQSPIRVEIQYRTAILRGTVTTEHDRTLAERMARLEPGVERVRNELVAAASERPPDEPATP